jgi:glycosyltransferase involved in cell wall biosynthesis
MTMGKNSILFLTNAYPDFDSSYRGIFIKQMALYLTEAGFKISIVTPKIYRKSPFFESQNRILVYRFPFFAGDKLLIEHEKVPYVRMVLYYITGFFFSLYAILKNRCDLIHVHWAIPTGLTGVVVGKLLRKPMIVTVHGSDLRMAMAGSPLLNKIFVLVCRNARHLHLVSEMMKKEIDTLGIPQERISIWPMGVEEVFWQCGRNRKRRSNGDPVTVLSNRNLLPVYDVSCLIRAIPLILKEEPGVRFLIAGEGSEKEKLESEAMHLNHSSSIQFLGRVPHDQMPGLLAGADIYVSTSLSDGTSVSLLEAMASGVFPIVTDIPSNREWITDGENGFLVSAGNEIKLADRIIGTIRNEELMEKGVERNREIVKEKAYWEGNIHKMVEIYEQSLGAG